MTEKIPSISELENGLILIVEEMPDMESVAWELSVPGGITLDEPGEEGLSLILAELMSRGAGPYDSRAFSNAHEDKGIRHSEGAGMDRISVRGLSLAENLEEGIRLLSLMVQEPTLPKQDVESIQSLLLQDIASLYDNPGRRVMHELMARYFPAPWNRSPLGTAEGIQAVSLPRLHAAWKRFFAPRGAVLSVAGKCSASEVQSCVTRLFREWKGEAASKAPFGAMPAPAAHHIVSDSAQLQIALGWPSTRFDEAHYYTAKVVSGILSGGMFGRLFTEVREKRGLVYSVYARHQASKDYGMMTAYAGTTPERAQETCDVMLEVLRGVRGAVTGDELKRVKANHKASIIIGDESSSSRASSNAHDWWVAKRVRTLDEIAKGIDDVTVGAIDEYLSAYPVASIMTVTLGSREILPF